MIPHMAGVVNPMKEYQPQPRRNSKFSCSAMEDVTFTHSTPAHKQGPASSNPRGISYYTPHHAAASGTCPVTDLCGLTNFASSKNVSVSPSTCLKSDAQDAVVGTRCVFEAGPSSHVSPFSAVAGKWKYECGDVPSQQRLAHRQRVGGGIVFVSVSNTVAGTDESAFSIISSLPHLSVREDGPPALATDAAASSEFCRAPVVNCVTHLPAGGDSDSVFALMCSTPVDSYTRTNSAQRVDGVKESSVCNSVGIYLAEPSTHCSEIRSGDTTSSVQVAPQEQELKTGDPVSTSSTAVSMATSTVRTSVKQSEATDCPGRSLDFNQQANSRHCVASPSIASHSSLRMADRMSVKSKHHLLDAKVGQNRFIIKTQIGAGSFGEIFWGIDTWFGTKVAIKIEQTGARQQQLLLESRIYKLLHINKQDFHPTITRYNPETLKTRNAILPSDDYLMDPLRMVAGKGGLQSYDMNQGGHSSGKGVSAKQARIVPAGAALGTRARGGHAVFSELMEVVGFPHCHYYGVEGDYNIMVIDLLGPNLEDLFNYCGRQFSVKTVFLLADQMLHRLEYLHHKGFVHRDLKPENFVMGGSKDTGHIVHMIDYGLAKRFWDYRTNQHVVYKEGKLLTGTVRYCSINAHLGIEQSRRDDMESLGYIILYFLKKGTLPWQGIRGAIDANHKKVHIYEKKISISLEALCHDEPSSVYHYMKYVRGLKYEEAPDYHACREFFAQWLDRKHVERDWVFDWVLRREARLQQERQVPPNPKQLVMSQQSNRTVQ